MGIAAAAAQIFRGISAQEAVVYCICPIRIQDLLQRLLEDVSEGDITLVIQAAGDDGAVAQDADLITHSIAEYPLAALRGGKIRPIEFVTVFQVDPLSNPGAVAFGDPFLWEMGLQGLDDLRVQRVRSAVIPKPIADDAFALSGGAKVSAALQIGLKGNGNIIGFERMERNIHFVQSRGGQQNFLLFGK